MISVTDNASSGSAWNRQCVVLKIILLLEAKLEGYKRISFTPIILSHAYFHRIFSVLRVAPRRKKTAIFPCLWIWRGLSKPGRRGSGFKGESLWKERLFRRKKEARTSVKRGITVSSRSRRGMSAPSADIDGRRLFLRRGAAVIGSPATGKCPRRCFAIRRKRLRKSRHACISETWID